MATVVILALLARSALAWPVLSITDLWGHDTPEVTNRLSGNYSLGQDVALNRTGKVLNFIPIPVSEECLSDDGRRSGVCLNTYECRIQNGVSHGACALGFGVCCVFTASCGKEIDNNVTYFVNPHFPGLSRHTHVCTLRIRKISPAISQLRLDFVHFNLGQPNRRTGVCESDTFVMSGGTSKQLTLCGQNSGQHVYYDVEAVRDPITITMNMSRPHMSRMWEIRVTQIEFNQRAPAGCMQYFREPTGVIQTMNFGENGRHLANQDYGICMRQATGRCSIVYEPCDENSFKLGPSQHQAASEAEQAEEAEQEEQAEQAEQAEEAEQAEQAEQADESEQEQTQSDNADEGSGEEDFAPAPRRRSRQASPTRECDDRIVMPCDSEEFIMAETGGPGLCDVQHCGSSFCTEGESPCRIESSTTPFNIRVQFGPGRNKHESPEDNLGMCLRYEQQPC